MFKRFLIGVAFASLAASAFAQSNSPATMRMERLSIGSGTAAQKAAAATAGAATLSKTSGVITSEALVTAAAASYTLTLTNTEIAATDIVLASVAYGTATTGEPAISRITPGAGSVVIIVRNNAAAAALNGTIKVSFAVIKNP